MNRFEEKENTAPAPRPLERAGRGAAEEQSPAAEQSFFRGEADCMADRSNNENRCHSKRLW